jgi:hypothetical protein
MIAPALAKHSSVAVGTGSITAILDGARQISLFAKLKLAKCGPGGKPCRAFLLPFRSLGRVVPAIHALATGSDVDALDVRAFTLVFAGPCAGMTRRGRYQGPLAGAFFVTSTGRKQMSRDQPFEDARSVVALS